MYTLSNIFLYITKSLETKAFNYCELLIDSRLSRAEKHTSRVPLVRRYTLLPNNLILPIRLFIYIHKLTPTLPNYC